MRFNVRNTIVTAVYEDEIFFDVVRYDVMDSLIFGILRTMQISLQ